MLFPSLNTSISCWAQRYLMVSLSALRSRIGPNCCACRWVWPCQCRQDCRCRHQGDVMYAVLVVFYALTLCDEGNVEQQHLCFYCTHTPLVADVVSYFRIPSFFTHFQLILYVTNSMFKKSLSRWDFCGMVLRASCVPWYSNLMSLTRF